MDNFDNIDEEKNIFSFRKETTEMQLKKRFMKANMEIIKNFVMSTSERIVYMLKFEKNKTHSEISELLSISETTSKNLLCKAKKKISKVTEMLNEKLEKL